MRFYNIKKLLIFLLLTVPVISMAQSEWEVPTQVKPEKTEALKKDASEVKAKVLDPKYAAGTVPVVDGKVEWNKTIEISGMGGKEVYEKTLAALTELTKSKQQKGNSRIIAVNSTERIIAAAFEEEMVFSEAKLAKDFTEFYYTIIAKCFDGKVELRFCRISYAYHNQNPQLEKYTAEEWITDKECLNKKGTKLYRVNGKFRKKTIDRQEEVFSFISERIKK